MNSRQRAVVGLALAGIAATTLVTPYRWSGHTGVGSSAAQASGVAYRPLWNEPKPETVDFFTVGSKPSEIVFVSDVALDSGRIGLWWAGIVILAAASVLLLASQPSAVPRASSP